MAEEKLPRVVIVGAGFGGLEAAKKLACEKIQLIVIDRTNYHLFQPLLYQVATAALSPADIAAPVRAILHKCKNVEVMLAEVQSVDVNKRIVHAGDLDLTYDYLILATGARHSYFGHPEWERLAPGLKSLEDAVEIRRRILLAFEYAEKISDPAARAAAMTFVIVGGGPTGVEIAGAIAEIARYTLARDFRHIDPTSARVVLIESEPQVLAAFPEDLQVSAMKQGRHAARNILGMIEGRKPQRFWYFDKGSMATIGRNKAVADLHLLHLSGLPAWVAWLFVHILFLVGFRNRVVVLLQWAWAYFTFNKGARLITRNFQAETRPPK